MKTSTAVLLGAVAIALAIYLGLTYDKRSWLEACVKMQGRSQELCEMSYRAHPK